MYINHSLLWKPKVKLEKVILFSMSWKKLYYFQWVNLRFTPSFLKKILSILPKILWSYRMTPTLLQWWCLQVMAYDWGQSRASSFFWAWTYYCSYLPYTPTMHNGTCGYKNQNSHIWKHPCIPVFDVNPTLLEFFRSNFDNKT